MEKIRILIKNYFEKKATEKKQFRERLKEVAKELSTVFEHRELREALEKNRYQVIGYINDMYHDFEKLIEHKKDLIDLACYYSRTERKPAIYSVVPRIILDSYEETIVVLDNPTEFDNFPGEKFSEIKFLAPVHLENALHWIENYKHKLDGYPTRVRMGRCNMMMLGKSRHGRFVILVRDAPGTYDLLYNAVIEAKNIDQTIKKDQQRLINHLMGEKELKEDQIDESAQKAELYKAAYIVRTKDIQAERQHNLEQEFKKRLKESEYSKKKVSVDWTAIIIIVFFAVLALVVAWFFLNFIPINTGSTSVENLSTSTNILKLMSGGL